MAWLTPFNKPLTEWRGRSVWLVGASSGIGLACAKALHAQGAKVCVSARQEALLQAFVSDHPGSMALPLKPRPCMRWVPRCVYQPGKKPCCKPLCQIILAAWPCP